MAEHDEGHKPSNHKVVSGTSGLYTFKVRYKAGRHNATADLSHAFEVEIA